ncbi:FGGY-family carbohydrate kinase [Bacillus velezensis]
MKTITKDKLSGTIYSVGEKAGGLTEKMAELTGLLPGTAVAVANVDAHVSVPAVGITEPGKMLMIMGTSTCHVLLGDEEHIVPGMCGVVNNGILPGYAGYEAGQSCVGDHFEWFVKTCVPRDYVKEAEDKHIDIHELLSKKQLNLFPGKAAFSRLTGGTETAQPWWTPI